MFSLLINRAKNSKKPYHWPVEFEPRLSNRDCSRLKRTTTNSPLFRAILKAQAPRSSSTSKPKFKLQLKTEHDFILIPTRATEFRLVSEILIVTHYLNNNGNHLLCKGWIAVAPTFLIYTIPQKTVLTNKKSVLY